MPDQTPTLGQRIAERLTAWMNSRFDLASLTPDLTDKSPAWTKLGGGLHNDRPLEEIQQGYKDALEAWRKNPLAKRIVDTVTDYVIGDGLRPTATGQIGRFVDQFWNHRQNRMEMRLPDLVDELTRAGDIFLLLFRNDQDGMSYVRSIPKSEIVKIETADNDWERELVYHQRQKGTLDTIRWLSPQHPDASEQAAVMVHYAINRPVGALLGEGDLATVTPWLLHYSKMLEDRVRLNYFARAFYWIVTVSKGMVAEVANKYKRPPEPGSIIVKSEGETWEMLSPNLQAGDAANDLHAIRLMISAGSGQPPHWHGDGQDVNLANGQDMSRSALRHLGRRQREVEFMLIDLCYIAYSRAFELGNSLYRATPDRKKITVQLPDINRDDNEALAVAGKELTAAYAGLLDVLQTPSATLREVALRTTFAFIGEPLEDATARRILRELEDTAAPANDTPPADEEVEDAPQLAAVNGHHNDLPLIWR